MANRRAEVVLAGYGDDPALPRAALADPSGAVRAAALRALERQGHLGDAELVAALTDPDATVRRRAAEIAARAGGADSVGALAGLLRDPDDRVVETAAFACGEHAAAGGQVLDLLCGIATGHTDALCREAAVAAIGSLAGRGIEGSPGAALTTVLEACGDRATVRRRAVLALAAFDDPSATEALRSLIADRDLQVRQAAEELLAIEEGD